MTNFGLAIFTKTYENNFQKIEIEINFQIIIFILYVRMRFVTTRNRVGFARKKTQTI